MTLIPIYWQHTQIQFGKFPLMEYFYFYCSIHRQRNSGSSVRIFLGRFRDIGDDAEFLPLRVSAESVLPRTGLQGNLNSTGQTRNSQLWSCQRNDLSRTSFRRSTFLKNWNFYFSTHENLLLWATRWKCPKMTIFENSKIVRCFYELWILHNIRQKLTCCQKFQSSSWKQFSDVQYFSFIYRNDEKTPTGGQSQPSV